MRADAGRTAGNDEVEQRLGGLRDLMAVERHGKQRVGVAQLALAVFQVVHQRDHPGIPHIRVPLPIPGGEEQLVALESGRTADVQEVQQRVGARQPGLRRLADIILGREQRMRIEPGRRAGAEIVLQRIHVGRQAVARPVPSRLEQRERPHPQPVAGGQHAAQRAVPRTRQQPGQQPGPQPIHVQVAQHERGRRRARSGRHGTSGPHGHLGSHRSVNPASISYGLFYRTGRA